MGVNNLPNWGIPNIHPAFFDVESATAIEMVAKLYSKMKELVEEYNKFEKDTAEKVDEAYNYLKTNLQKACMEAINEMLKTGEFYIGIDYKEETESLNIILSEVNNDE